MALDDKQRLLDAAIYVTARLTSDDRENSQLTSLRRAYYPALGIRRKPTGEYSAASRHD
jgi:hypothetical protein